MMCAMRGARQRVKREIHSVNLIDCDWYVNWIISSPAAGGMRLARNRSGIGVTEWSSG